MVEPLRRKPKEWTKERKYRNLKMSLALNIPAYKITNIPIGYYKDPDRKGQLVPDLKVLRVLLKAKEYLESNSYATVTEWLKEHFGIRITRKTLHKIMQDRPPNEAILLPYDERLKRFRQYTAAEEAKEGT